MNFLVLKFINQELQTKTDNELTNIFAIYVQFMYYFCRGSSIDVLAVDV